MKKKIIGTEKKKTVTEVQVETTCITSLKIEGIFSLHLQIFSALPNFFKS